MAEDKSTNDQVESQEDDAPEPVNVEEYQREVARLKRELTDVRQEAAAKRVELRDVREQLATAKSLDEYNALNDRLVATEKKAAHDAMVSQHAASLPEKLRNSVTWPEDEDGIKALATDLSQFSAVVPNESAPSGGLGPRGGSDEDFDPRELVASIPR